MRSTIVLFDQQTHIAVTHVCREINQNLSVTYIIYQFRTFIVILVHITFPFLRCISVIFALYLSKGSELIFFSMAYFFARERSLSFVLTF